MSPFDEVYEKLNGLYAYKKYEEITKYIERLQKKEIYNPWCNVFLGLCAIQSDVKSVQFTTNAIMESYEGAAVVYGKGTDFLSYVVETSSLFVSAITQITSSCSDTTQKMYALAERENQSILRQVQLAANRLHGYEFERYKKDMLARLDVIAQETNKATKPFNDVMGECSIGSIKLFEAASNVLKDYASFEEEDYKTFAKIVHEFEENNIDPIREFASGPFGSSIRYFDDHKDRIYGCINGKKEYEKELAEQKRKQMVAEYWSERQSEFEELKTKKEGLASEKKVLESKIEELENEIKRIDDEKNIQTETQKEIFSLTKLDSELQEKLNSLGLFARKEKRQVKSDIEETETRLESLKNKAREEWKKLALDIENRIGEKRNEEKALSEKVSELDNKIDEVVKLMEYPVME